MEQTARDLSFVKSGPDFEPDFGSGLRSNPVPKRVRLLPGGLWHVSGADTSAAARKAAK